MCWGKRYIFSLEILGESWGDAASRQGFQPASPSFRVCSLPLMVLQYLASFPSVLPPNFSLHLALEVQQGVMEVNPA